MFLRITPWIADASIHFLNNLFKWYPDLIKQKLSVLEWGGGNSTIYFLQKKCQVLTIESDDAFISDLCLLAEKSGFSVKVTNNIKQAMAAYEHFDLTILKAQDYSEIGDIIFEFKAWSIVVNDGISRKEVIEAISAKATQAIVVLDNGEYCANWGRLARSSGKTETVRAFRKFIRNPSWQKVLFEQSEGRCGHGSADHTGWESPNRQITGIHWQQDHLLSTLMVTQIGLPLVNLAGEDDEDLNSVEERCPFDWEENKWAIEEYPETLDLKLTRRFD